MTTVALYTRLSSDPTGQQTATPRQQKACRAFAELRGWEVVRVFEDVDLSAYQRGVVRPAYEEMLRAIRSKAVDGVVAWKLDRFVRRSSEFERLWTTCDDAGVFLASVTEPIDTSTELGLALVRVLVAFASLESATSSVRISAKLRERAELGVPHNGKPAYGYKRGWKRLEPKEAARVREAADHILAGKSMNSLIVEWRRQGVKSPTGINWGFKSLKDMLMSARIAGLRVHQGEVIGEGNWPAIVTVEEHERLKQVLSDPARGTVLHLQPHLLKGVLRCGKCGQRLYRFSGKGRKNKFGCSPAPRGCSGVSAREDYVLEAVTEALLERLRDTRYGARSEDVVREVHEVAVEASFDEYGAALKALAVDHFVRREITRSQFDDAQEALYAAAEQRLRTNRERPAVLRGVQNRVVMRTRWDKLPIEEQQTLLRDHVAYVIVHSAPRTGRYFNPMRLEIRWIDDLLAGQRPAAWVTAAEAAELLGVSRTTINRRVRDGVLEPDHVGGMRLFRRYDIDRVLRERGEAGRGPTRDWGAELAADIARRVGGRGRDR